MKQPKFAFLMLLAALFTIISCEKTGPSGLTGQQGSAGPQGPTGPQGPQGDTGVANVQYSPWIDVEWTNLASGASTSSLINATAISNQVIDSGIVLVYMRPDSVTNSPFLLPYTAQLTATSSFVIQFALEEGGGGLTVSGTLPTSGNLGAGAIYPNAQIRYVIIPPGLAIPAGISYEQLIKRFRITN